MKRRYILKLIGIGSLILLGTTFFLDQMGIRIFLRKVRGKLKKTPGPLPEKRAVQPLPAEGTRISIEKAINSRCCSDNDDNPEVFHWGMFDRLNRLSEDQIQMVVDYSRIPIFNEKYPFIKTNNDLLSFVLNPSDLLDANDQNQIKSGIQQQCISLICAALGVGMVFRNQGKDGRYISGDEFRAIKIKLDAMKPSYNGSYWSDRQPEGENQWISGNLSDPQRDGNLPLVDALSEIQFQKLKGNSASIENISQLLWAARGRTPHLYKSIPWGMTIPTWAGEQTLSDIYLVYENKIFKYLNNKKGRPTHSVQKVSAQNADVVQSMEHPFGKNNCAMVLSVNENKNRALWEVGYQIMNTLAQLVPLGVAYKLIFLNEDQKKLFNSIPSGNPVVVIIIKAGNKLMLG